MKNECMCVRVCVRVCNAWCSALSMTATAGCDQETTARTEKTLVTSFILTQQLLGFLPNLPLVTVQEEEEGNKE